MKLIILDRDGVINQDSNQFIKSPDEWIPIPGALEAIARLNQADYRVVIATNQSGIGRGLFGMDTLNAIHKKLHAHAQHVGARIDAIFFCPHLADDHCDCRKPKNGLLTEIARRFDTNLQDVPSVGDSLRDLEASVSVGCRPYLVLTGKGMLTNTVGGLPAGTQVCADLAAVAEQLLSPAGLTNAVELSH